MIQTLSQSQQCSHLAELQSRLLCLRPELPNATTIAHLRLRLRLRRNLPGKPTLHTHTSARVLVVPRSAKACSATAARAVLMTVFYAPALRVYLQTPSMY
jgi:hypothetical protein